MNKPLIVSIFNMFVILQYVLSTTVLFGTLRGSSEESTKNTKGPEDPEGSQYMEGRLFGILPPNGALIGYLPIYESHRDNDNIPF